MLEACGIVLAQGVYAEKVVAALSAAGRLQVPGGQPSSIPCGFTDAQVEAAAKAFYETPLGLTDWDRMADVEPDLARRYRESMSRALSAAAGAAPQAESVPKSSYINPALPGMIRNLWKTDPSERSVQTALKLAGDLIQELIDLRAAPHVGVDVDKLTVVIGNAEATWQTMRGHETRLAYVARVVAAWIKEQGGESCD